MNKRVLTRERESSRPHTSSAKDFTMLVKVCKGIVHHVEGVFVKVIPSNKVVTEVEEITTGGADRRRVSAIDVDKAQEHEALHVELVSGMGEWEPEWKTS